MSMERTEKITCPDCGKETEVVIWQSLNGDLDPEAKQQLLDGTLFLFECSHCGYQSNLNYGTLYHDMSHSVMVYYVAENEVEDTMKELDNSESAMGFPLPNYKKRIVTDQNSLREKAIIFDNELDDRIIEIIKLIYFANARKQHPEANIKAVYFMVVDGAYTLQFLGDTPLTATIPADLYKKIEGDMAERLTAVGDEYIVDIRWASGFMKR